MSKQTAWLELFSGVVIDEPDNEDRRGKLTAAVDKAAAAQAVFLRRQKAQADALAVVREKFDTIKGDVQQVMSEKIKSGPFKGKSFLDVEKGQVDEIDIEDITAEAQKSGKPPLPKDLTAKLLKHGNGVAGLGVELREARFKPDPEVDKDEPLFTNAELQAEFWTPVMRERAFPEGFIAAPWSATQQMLDQTTALYQEMVEQKKIAGELTPDRDFLKDALETGAQVLSVGAEALKGFDGKQIELAKEILETGSEVINSMGEVRDKLKNTEFTDAASVALDICGSLASAALKGAGVDAKIVDATTGAIGAGSAAILLGKTLNQVRLGEADLSQALTQMGDVLAKALTTASEGTAGATKDGLAIAAKAAPTLFKALGLGTDLPELVRNGDTKSVIDRLAEIAKDVLAQLPGLDKLGVDLGQVVDLGAAGLNLAVKTAFAVKKGEYAKAFNEVVAEVGGKLGDVLKTAGVDEGLAGQIVKLYQGASSVPQAIDALRQDPPKVGDAVNALAGGIQSALGGSGDKTLASVGEGIAKGIETLVAADQVRKLYTEGKYDEAVKLVASQLESGVGKLFGALGIQMPGGGSDDSGGQPDSGAMDTLKELVGKLKSVKVDPALVKEASALMQKKKDEEQAAADVAEAEELLAQAELDLKSLSQAQRTGAEASNIEQMIADLLRDRMILKLATQIAQGGAAFLAQFLPGLGAASAGIKLAASLFAAGQRAKQLDEWIRSQSDLQNAQSALSSSAANFVKNQGQQLAHYSAQAFFAAAQLGGEIAKLAGPGAPAGAIISAAAAAGAKTEELLMDLKNKYDVEAGWKATKKALANPANRRMGLEARQLNPTLAKYSLAWGAVVLKDPLARGAMKACGLTEASLNDEKADTHKVVKYLEVFYEDDVSIYRDNSEELPKWVPAEIELTLSCWAAFRRGADGVKLTIGEATLVEGLLGEFDGVQEAAEATSAELEAQQQALTEAGKALRQAAGKGDGGGMALPDTTALETAIGAHEESLRVRSETAQRLHHALLASKAAAVDPSQKGKEEALKGAAGALAGFQAKAKRVQKAAAQDADGLKEAKLELGTTMAALKQQVEKAKAEQVPPTRPRSNAGAPRPEKVGG